VKSKNHDYLGILDEIEDKEMTETGKRGLGLGDMKDLSDPQAGPKADGGESNDDAGPADPDGSNDDNPTVTPGDHGTAIQHQDDTDEEAGETKLSDMVKTLSASDKATLRKLLDEE
jgi:hypothetical protein